MRISISEYMFIFVTKILFSTVTLFYYEKINFIPFLARFYGFGVCPKTRTLNR